MVGLANFFRSNSEKFKSRLSKGPPPAYRWLAWQFAASLIIEKEKGLYEAKLQEGEDGTWLHDIDKDLNRTFPAHPYFAIDKYGVIGQKALRNILQAYAVYMPQVGYCQSMNFIAGLVLMVSGSREKEAFWVLTALLTETQDVGIDLNLGAQNGQMDPGQGLAGIDHKTVPVMSGLHGFYSQGFPLLAKFLSVFNTIFQEMLPDLFDHFRDEGIPDLLWIHKWFQSCFLYSFPQGLCIRIWDNIWANGTRFLFQAAIAVLKLIKNDLISLGFAEINERLKKLKDDEHDRQGGSWTKHTLLPEYEKIISEARNVKITDEMLRRLFYEYDREQERFN